MEVEVHLRDGRSDRVRIDKAPGSPARELTWDELRLKFLDCARHTKRIDEAKAARAFEAIQRLEELDDVATLVELLR